jgi:hypothetical protein
MDNELPIREYPLKLNDEPALIKSNIEMALPMRPIARSDMVEPRRTWSKTLRIDPPWILPRTLMFSPKFTACSTLKSYKDPNRSIPKILTVEPILLTARTDSEDPTWPKLNTLMLPPTRDMRRMESELPEN